MYKRLLWNKALYGPMTESAIRVLPEHLQRTRMSKYTYPADDEIEGTSKPCRGYVLAGQLALRSNDCIASFEAGDVFEFAGGDYVLRIGKASDAIVIWAWELPPGFG
jgi:hypothetical protein